MYRNKIRSRAMFMPAVLVAALLLLSCTEPESHVEPGENDDAIGYGTDYDIITRPPVDAERFAEEWAIDLVILSDGALWMFNPVCGESNRLAALPSGYSPVSGPVCSPGGERIYCTVRDQLDAVWIACYQVADDRWEIRFLEGATDWDGWTDGYLPKPSEAGLIWWRNYWDTSRIVAEMFYTDLEEMSTVKVAVFYEEMLYPHGWSADGSLLICQAFTPRTVSSFPAGFYLFEPGSRPREIDYLADQLHQSWLELLEIDVKHVENTTVDLFYLGWNPYRDGDIWLTEVVYEYAFGNEVEVALKRVHRDGSGYQRLNLRMDLGNLWRVDWHPAAPSFLAYTNDRPFPTESFRLYLVDLESFQKKLLGDDVQGACWRLQKP